MTNNQLTHVDPGALANAGQAANEAAARGIFSEYRARKAQETTRRQDGDLILFADYLALANVDRPPAALATTPAAWAGITWGIVEGFKRWMITAGYSIASVNTRLSTIRTYAQLATKAGAVDRQEGALIQTVTGYSRKDGKHIDQRREVTRIGRKKASWVSLSKEQAGQLKDQPNTPQGRRDSVIIHLLADLGLRCGELAGLAVGNVDLQAGELQFYRPKVDLEQTHHLPTGARQALGRYLEFDALAAGPLLRASDKAGELTHAGMSTQAISGRIRTLGRALGIEGLSAHDLRHYWATQAARNGTPVDRLQQAGGWTSPAMALRYVEQAKIANDGVKVG
jgi:integrase